MSLTRSLGLWWHLRRHSGTVGLGPIRVPGGSGPLVWICCTDGGDSALRQVLRALQAHPALRIAISLPGAGTTAPATTLPEMSGQQVSIVPGPGHDPRATRKLLTALRPDAVLALGSSVPAALAVECSDAALPLLLAEMQCSQNCHDHCICQYRLAARASRILVTDENSRQVIQACGALPDRVSVTGPVSDLREPLGCLEPERAMLADQLARRQVWLAAALPPSEEIAWLTAHRAALRHSHRALAIVMPADPARGPDLTRWLESEGLTVAERARDEEPEPDIQVLVADDPAEMGLWYRLASVCFMGGTLSGHDSAARHPFEPAALGSAILHGPYTERHQTAWGQLDGACAARPVRDAAGLAQGVADLIAPDQAAQLATNAWAVATGGAEAAQQIAQACLHAAQAHAERISA